MTLSEPLSHFLFEIMVFALFAVCLINSVCTQRPPHVSLTLELLVFVLYGLTFESVAVSAGLYEYAPFTFKIGHAPLVIGVSWAVIGFSVMRFTDSLNMEQWSKPFLEALLALLIDLGMDAVAIRDLHTFAGETTGMWRWGLPLDEEWFGVPYANFMAWWLIIFVMSAALRSGRYLCLWFGKSWLAWYPLGALLAASTFFSFLLLTFASAFNLSILLLFIGLSVIVSVLSVRGRQTKLSWRADAPVFLVPLAFHLFFLSLLVGRKLYADSPTLLLVSVAVFALNELVLVAAEY